MFIDRNENGDIRAANRAEQYEGQEELANDHADVVAFMNPPELPDLMEKLRLAVKDLGNGKTAKAKAL